MKRQNDSADEESPRKKKKISESESPSNSHNEDSEQEEIVPITDLLTRPEKEWLRKDSSGSIESAAFWDNYTLLKTNGKHHRWLTNIPQGILPNELLLIIFGFLDQPTLLNFGMTCKFLADLLPKFDPIWRILFRDRQWRLPHELRNKNYRMGGNQISPIEIEDREVDWFEEFKRNYVNNMAIKPLLLSIDEKFSKICNYESGLSSADSTEDLDITSRESEPSKADESSNGNIYLENFKPGIDVDRWEKKNNYYLSNDLKTYFQICNGINCSYEMYSNLLAAAPLDLPYLQTRSKSSNMALDGIELYTATDNEESTHPCLDLLANEPKLRTAPYEAYRAYEDILESEEEFELQEDLSEGDDSSSEGSEGSSQESDSDQISGMLFFTNFEYEPAKQIFWDPMTNCIFVRDKEDYSCRYHMTLVEWLQSLDDALTVPVPRNPPWSSWRSKKVIEQPRPKNSDEWDTMIYDTLDDNTKYGIDRRATLLLKSAAQQFITEAIAQAEEFITTDLNDEKYNYFTSEKNEAALRLAKALYVETKESSEDTTMVDV